VTPPDRSGWWVEAFGVRISTRTRTATIPRAATEVAFVASLLKSAAGARILDAGCGAGRQRARARPARREGDRVSTSRRSSFRRRAARGPEDYVRADLRDPPVPGRFVRRRRLLLHLLRLLRRGRNRAQLTEMRRVLKKGGIVRHRLPQPQARHRIARPRVGAQGRPLRDPREALGSAAAASRRKSRSTTRRTARRASGPSRSASTARRTSRPFSRALGSASRRSTEISPVRRGPRSPSVS